MKHFYLTILLTLLCHALVAQVLTQSVRSPERSSRSKSSSLRTIPNAFRLEKGEVASLIAEDEREAGRGIPPRFGKPVPLSLDLATAGSWKSVKGGRMWTFSLTSPGAFSLNFFFDKFYLPLDAELYLYNSDRSIEMGPITATQNNKAGVYATDLLKGDFVTFELFEPAVSAGKSVLHAARVVHGYKNVFREISANSYGEAALCNVDVNCPAGNGWQTESNAVAMILEGNGNRLATGTLLNDACQSLTPNFLTAFHNLDGNGDGKLSSDEKSQVQSWVFRFQYKSPTCGGGDGVSYTSFSGAQFLAADKPTDFALLVLNQRPPAGSGIAYAGWSRVNTAPTSAASIHYPAGDVMKIALANGAVQPVNSSYWHADFTTGTVQRGSSGGPLFDQNHRVVGQLFGDLGGSTDYCAIHRGDYGRFAVSWTGGGTPQTRLQDWLTLDPSVTQTNTLEVIPVTTGPDQVCSRGPSLATYLPCGANVTICSDQCVAYGAAPSAIKGRILADDGSSTWQAYVDAAQAVGSSAFASGREHEWVQWQVSYDNSNWSNINGANQSSYQPGAVTRKTYYRRASSHINYHWYGDSREYWYTSNVVTITPGSAPPSPARSSYATCNSAALTVAITPVATAPSYNWYAEDASWSINGTGRALSNTSSTSVQIIPPAGVAPGTYRIYVSANSACGNKSRDAIIDVIVTNTGPSTPTSAYFSPSNGSSDCYPIYDIITSPVAGATEYQATLSNGQSSYGYFDANAGYVLFPFGVTGPQYGITATITVIGACGQAPSFTTDPQYLNGPSGPYCDSFLQQQSIKAYPNPATDQVMVQGLGKEVQIVFYDGRGVSRKTIAMHRQDAQTIINVLDLPAGLYHLRFVADGKVIMSKQLLVQH